MCLNAAWTLPRVLEDKILLSKTAMLLDLLMLSN
jgi:hypothetical protein